MEPTGHYWFNLGKFLQDNEMKPVLVNPHHVKKTKELDDNNPTKNDRKDPKVIAGLVREGRYMIPYLPDGVYADLRTASNIRFQLQAELTRIQNRIRRWFNIYFPEYKTVYGKPDAKSGMLILKAAPLPEDILTLGIDGVNQIWRDAKLRAVGKARAKILIENSIGNRNTGDFVDIKAFIEIAYKHWIINTGECHYKVSAKYSCGFSNLLDSSIIVNER